jgi:hypothetical protein
MNDGANLLQYPDALNPFFDVERYISLRDQVTTPPPEHLPKQIEAAFKEGAACLAIECFNAAATMFRALGRAPATRTPATRVGGLRLDPRAN